MCSICVSVCVSMPLLHSHSLSFSLSLSMCVLNAKCWMLIYALWRLSSKKKRCKWGVRGRAVAVARAKDPSSLVDVWQSGKGYDAVKDIIFMISVSNLLIYSAARIGIILFVDCSACHFVLAYVLLPLWRLVLFAFNFIQLSDLFVSQNKKELWLESSTEIRVVFPLCPSPAAHSLRPVSALPVKKALWMVVAKDFLLLLLLLLLFLTRPRPLPCPMVRSSGFELLTALVRLDWLTDCQAVAVSRALRRSTTRRRRRRRPWWNGNAVFVFVQMCVCVSVRVWGCWAGCPTWWLLFPTCAIWKKTLLSAWRLPVSVSACLRVRVCVWGQFSTSWCGFFIKKFLR